MKTHHEVKTSDSKDSRGIETCISHSSKELFIFPVAVLFGRCPRVSKQPDPYSILITRATSFCCVLCVKANICRDVGVHRANLVYSQGSGHHHHTCLD